MRSELRHEGFPTHTMLPLGLERGEHLLDDGELQDLLAKAFLAVVVVTDQQVDGRRSQFDVAPLNLYKAEELSGLGDGRQIIQVQTQPLSHLVNVFLPANIAHLLQQPKDGPNLGVRQCVHGGGYYTPEKP